MEGKVDVTKQYKTRSGKRVIGLIIHSDNDETNYTFPVKGSVVVREKPLKLEYAIWTLEGRFLVTGGENPRDLVEVQHAGEGSP